MSDRVNDLAKCYEDDVGGQHSRSVGLFPIPEYPELEAGRGMWSEVWGVLLTTLRYLAPATLLTLFWGQQSFLFRLLRSIDSAFRALVFSSEEQKQEVLKWLTEAGPVRLEKLDTVWRHGWIVCSVLDAALPGACAGHPPTRLSLKHAQAIADHYLGVEPAFSRQELEATDSLSRHQEWKLVTYLERIKQALSKITPPVPKTIPAVSKPVSPKPSPKPTQCTVDYVAKGSGLSAAQVNNRMYFKIYPTSQQALDPGEITILIRGPKDTYGMTVLPPLPGKAQVIRQKMLGLDTAPSYTENALPITQGATYLRAYGKNDMNKTFHIPKTVYDIDIETKIHSDYIRVGYMVTLEGKYEISITSRGQNIVGSPFLMKASTNIISTLEKESFCLEDGEEIDIVDVGTDKKVVLRIVDFVTEKMLLRENGSLEKISDDEAEKLLTTSDKSTDDDTDVDFRSCSAGSVNTEIGKNTTQFRDVSRNIIRMNRVCKVFDKICTEKQLKNVKKENSHPSNKQHIPDIVNSTFTDSKDNPFFLSVDADKFGPKSTAVLYTIEKSKPLYEENISTRALESDILAKEMEASIPDSLEEYPTSRDTTEEQLRTESSLSSSNPFFNDIYEEPLEKDLRTFVKSEFETNKSQSEETTNIPIRIVVEDDSDNATPIPINMSNPFLEPDILNMERPKTPILKIIKGEVEDRIDSVYVDQQAELFAEESPTNEFINPFFIHSHRSFEERMPIADFVIGAPVSLPPMIRSKTPEPDVDSILVTSHPENCTVKVVEGYVTNNPDTSIESMSSSEQLSKQLSEPSQVQMEIIESNNIQSSTFHSIDSNFTDNVDGLGTLNGGDNRESYHNDEKSDKNVTNKREMWDSAYVSIDENSSCPDSNNNDNNQCEYPDKSILPSDEDYSNMGPAEKEIWLTCKDLKENIPKVDSLKLSKSDPKTQIFTPIIEENDKSLLSGIKEEQKSDDLEETLAIDTVPVTFAELNTNLYMECLTNKSNANNNSLKGKDYINKKNNTRESVDSASELLDVKRHAKKLEGKISEVQSNVTESGSVSQTLRHIRNNRQSAHTGENIDVTKNNNEFHNIVIAKKHYWDQRIRDIEAKSKQEENKNKKRRLSTRNLIQNDSLTKKRAKEIANNFLTTKENQRLTQAKYKSHDIQKAIDEEPIRRNLSEEHLRTDSKLVEKWKKYWDSKMEWEREATKVTCCKSKSPAIREQRNMSPYQLKPSSSEDVIQVYKKPHEREKIEARSGALPAKQELSEEVFKAFETSPKRFFGTSRKQILTKIDSFLEKPSTANSSSTDVSGAVPDTGLVSSRISLFHTISNTEQPRVQRKCQSMYNISQRKVSESSISSIDYEQQRNTKLATETMSLMSQTGKSVNDNKNKYTTKVTENAKALHQNAVTENMTLQEKKSRLLQGASNRSLEETSGKKLNEINEIKYKRNKINKVPSVDSAFTGINKNCIHTSTPKSQHSTLKKSTVSKSEMDIFNKVTNKDNDDLDMHKSYDELPSINVKNFISLYESVSRSDDEKTKSWTRGGGVRSLQKHFESSSSLGAANKTTSSPDYQTKQESFKPLNHSHAFRNHNRPKDTWKNKSFESVSSSSIEPRSLDSTDFEMVSSPQPEKETTYISFSDIELEIVEHPNEESERPAADGSADHKSRFKMAKQFFQSLEELTPSKKPKKLNECEVLLLKSSTESLERPLKQKRVKTKTKSHSQPSSEISKLWKQVQNESDSKLMKISEKFNVDDLFSDVMEGKLSRQGSLRGIPHKKAVLETFRSMESLVPKKLSPYQMAVTQLSEFAKEDHVKSAQNYLSEYPYLPTTDPSKYQSRLDVRAQGLISLKELLNQKPRRNSVPDLRPFTVDL